MPKIMNKDLLLTMLNDYYKYAKDDKIKYLKKHRVDVVELRRRNPAMYDLLILKIEDIDKQINILKTQEQKPCQK